MSSGKITIGTVCFLIDRGAGKVLLLERSREPMAGMKTGVGGKTGFGEDIYDSCIREVKEETGFEAENLVLHGVLKTLHEEDKSSWILFVYSSESFTGSQIESPEGALEWIDLERFENLQLLHDLKLIGFIREIMPYVLRGGPKFEGTIKHDSKGRVLENKVKTIKS